MPTLLQHLPCFTLSCSIRFHSSMHRMDNAALMVDLPDDGEPEPDLEPRDDEGEDAITVRTKDGIDVQMEEGFDVAKLCDEELLELGWGPVPQDEAAFRWGACAP